MASFTSSSDQRSQLMSHATIAGPSIDMFGWLHELA